MLCSGGAKKKSKPKDYPQPKQLRAMNSTTSLTATNDTTKVHPTQEKKKRDNIGQEPHLEFLRLCEQYSFVGYSFERIDTKEVNGAWKKVPIGQPIRKGDRINKDTYKEFIKPSHRAFAIVTGAASGITVIDCDTPESYEKLIREFPELTDTVLRVPLVRRVPLRAKHVACLLYTSPSPRD